MIDIDFGLLPGRKNYLTVWYFGSKIISAMDDMMLVEKREFFEPDPDELRLDDEERHLNLFFLPNHFTFSIEKST